MKTLNEYLKEGLLENMKFPKTSLYESLLDDLDVLSDKADEYLLDSVKKWINSNYHVVELKISENTTEDGKLIVNCTRAGAN